jgi:hypothetical protein
MAQTTTGQAKEANPEEEEVTAEEAGTSNPSPSYICKPPHSPTPPRRQVPRILGPVSHPAGPFYRAVRGGVAPVFRS